MSKIYIDSGKDDSPIDTIAWINQDGREEFIGLNGNCISIEDEDVDLLIYKKDIPKLEAALAKARELGWGI
ncbi:hypothetical protein EKK58_12750 [Candidatus Dependentiae bacterium]|nr:MAG: hypothetical protein EKK58_12750 [Candidatus Dependentiae bacterium]